MHLAIPAYIQSRSFHRAEDACLAPPEIPDCPETERVLVGYREQGSDAPMIVREEALHFALERSGIDPACVDMDVFCRPENWGACGKEYIDWFYQVKWEPVYEEREVV